MILRIIYTIFLGIILATFVGIGIATFYPAPQPPAYPTLLSKVPAPPVTAPGQQLTPQQQNEQDQLRQAQTDYDAAQRDYAARRAVYNRNVSSLAIIAAVIILIVSLTAMQGLFIADGFLLGGVFTLLYGIGRGLIEGQDDRYRFAVITVGLVIALVLGYLRFVRAAMSHGQPVKR